MALKPLHDLIEAQVLAAGRLHGDETPAPVLVIYATRLRREVGEFLVGSCIRREPSLQHTQAFIQWAAAKTR